MVVDVWLSVRHRLGVAMSFSDDQLAVLLKTAQTVEAIPSSIMIEVLTELMRVRSSARVWHARAKSEFEESVTLPRELRLLVAARNLSRTNCANEVIG